MNILIEAIAYSFPHKVVSNADLQRQNPNGDYDRLGSRTGVKSRYIAGSGETALDLALSACKKLQKEGYDLSSTVNAIIFCTETPDHPIPPNSNILHGLLNLPNNVIAFDITAGCSGYVYGLEISRGLIASGAASQVLLATGDTYSKLIHPCDQSANCLFGDGAAVSLISAAEPNEGIFDLSLGSSGKEYERFIIPAGGTRMPRSTETQKLIQDKSGNIRSKEHILMDGFGVLSFFNDLVPKEVESTLRRNKLVVADVDYFIFHQASGIALDTLQRVLKIPDYKMARYLEDTGNLVSASLPVAIKKSIDECNIKPGNLVMLCGFGLGLSWGTALMRMPEVTD